MIYGAKALRAANNRCFVCEKPIAGGHWFAQVKHGAWTIRLCCTQCAQRFFAQRLPFLRRVGFQAALGSLAWPGQRVSVRCERNMNSGRSFSFFRCGALRPSTGAFTLMEVMIATGIFFLATFTILALVSTSLRNARALQRGDVDASMAASQVYQLLKTNRQAEVSGSGDFGEAYPDYSFEFASSQYRSNGLLQVKIVVHRRGNLKPLDTATLWVYAPEAKSSLGQPNLR